jgi:hypothetical protein
MWAIDLRSAIDFTSSILKVRSRIEQVIEKPEEKPVYLGKESPWPIHEYIKQDMSEFTVNIHFSAKPDYITVIKPGEKRPTPRINEDQWNNPYYIGNHYFDGPYAQRIGPYSDETVPQAYTSGLW